MKLRMSIAGSLLTLLVSAALDLPPSALAQISPGPQPQPRAWEIPADAANAATADLDEVMPVDLTVMIGRLDNGLRYFIRENQEPADHAVLRLVVNTGSLLEDDDQLGLAHFLEHMAFNGTRNFSQNKLISTLESFGARFGADINASTSFDETAYILRVPTDQPEILGTAFQILEDWAQGITLDSAEIDKERGVVIEEWRLGLGVGSRLRDKQLPVLFAGSRYVDRLPIGTLESLENFDHDALRRFYRDWYRPDLMAVIAVGDFDGSEVREYVDRHFSGLVNPPDPRPRDYYGLPPHADTLFAIVSDPEATYSSVSLYHKLPLRRQGTHGTYRRSLVENFYNSMVNRRLREAAQQPNPPFLGAGASQGIMLPTREVYVLEAGVPDGGIERGLEALLRESSRVARFGFTESELEREKLVALRGFERLYTERQTHPSDNYAEEFRRAFLEGESVPGIDYEWALYQRFVPEITIDEVNAAGAQWLNDTDRVVVVTAPEKDGVRLPTEAELTAILDRVDDRPMRRYVDTTVDVPLLADVPEPGSVVEETRNEELDITEWRLSNGVRVVLKPTDFRQDEVLMRAISPGGTSLASDEDWVAASSATQVVVASGAGDFSARQITNSLTGKVVSVTPTINVLEEGFVGSASPRDLEDLFQIVYLRFTQPRADPGVFRIIQDQFRASLANRDMSPEVAFREKLQTTLTQNHPRRRPITSDLVEEMDLDKSFAFYRDRFADASDFTFLFVGNIDFDELRALSERYLATLPSIGREESWRDEDVDPPTGVVKEAVYRGLEPKSLTSIVFTGDYDHEEGERFAMGALANVLQMRLRDRLREELGSTYSVSVQGSAERIPDPEYSVSISFGCDPNRVDELVQEVFDEIGKLKGSGPTVEEIFAVQEQSRRIFQRNSRQNGFWLGRLVAAYRGEDDPRESLQDVLNYEAALLELTAQQVQEAASTYLNVDNYVQVSLLPEAKAGDEGSSTR